MPFREDVVDLFSGPRGWDVAAVELGIDALGIDVDEAACATSEAAGFRTLRADVSELSPAEFGPVWGLIASPPCQAFSMAGSGHGRRAFSVYREAMRAMRAGEPVDRAKLDEACHDERAHLVLEPLRWTLALRPTWVACEQVEPVLPLWEEMALSLREAGYSAVAGVLRAEQYGVPQTRKRAILVARLDGDARLPTPTHRRYVAPRRKEPEATENLFDAGEPERIVERGEEHLLPWVSMAEALGWMEGIEPACAPTVTAGGGASGGVEVFASKAARSRASRAGIAGQRRSSGPGAVRDPRSLDEPSYTLRANAGGGSEGVGRSGGVEWVKDLVLRNGMNTMSSSRDPEDMVPYERPVTAPAPTLDAKVGTAWKVAPRGEHREPPHRWKLRAGARENSTERDVEEPAPTITGAHDHEDRVWVPEALSAGTNDHDATRAVDEPAPTLRGGGGCPLL